MAILLVLTSACSQPASDEQPKDQASAGETNAASKSVSVVKAGDWRRLAECSSKLDAVARVYDAASAQSSSDEGQELRAMYLQRTKDAGRFMMEAKRLELESTPDAALTLSPSDGVDKIRSETEAAIESERGRRPFDEFVIWVGREADSCAADMPPAP